MTGCTVAGYRVVRVLSRCRPRHRRHAEPDFPHLVAGGACHAGDDGVIHRRPAELCRRVTRVARGRCRNMSRGRAAHPLAVMTTGTRSRRHATVVERGWYPSRRSVATVARCRRQHVIDRLTRCDRSVMACRARTRPNATVIERRASPDDSAVAGIARLRRHDVGHGLPTCLRSVVARRARAWQDTAVVEQRARETHGAVADGARLRYRRMRSRHRHRVDAAAGPVANLAGLGCALEDAAHVTILAARRFVCAGQRKARAKMLCKCLRCPACGLRSRLANPEDQRDCHQQ